MPRLHPVDVVHAERQRRGTISCDDVVCKPHLYRLLVRPYARAPHPQADWELHIESHRDRHEDGLLLDDVVHLAVNVVQGDFDRHREGTIVHPAQGSTFHDHVEHELSLRTTRTVMPRTVKLCRDDERMHEDAHMGDDLVTFSLSQDEALVLFEWLQRAGDREDGWADQAEQRAVWDLSSTLEARLPVFAQDYDARVAAARARIRDATDC